MSAIKRICVSKTVVYQGPASWVDGCLTNSLDGVNQMGPGKFVIVSTTEPHEEIPDPDVKVDHYKFRPAGMEVE